MVSGHAQEGFVVAWKMGISEEGREDHAAGPGDCQSTVDQRRTIGS